LAQTGGLRIRAAARENHHASNVPDGTGWQRDLYRVEGLPEALAHVVDTEANYALQKIVRGDTTTWSTKTRSAWTRFILFLLFRNPETVLVTKRQMQDVWRAGVENLQVNYGKLRRPTDPPTFEELMPRKEPAA
jgi:hypothetical protein